MDQQPAPLDMKPRKYIQFPDDEFLKIAQAAKSIREIMEKTNMSQFGIQYRLKKLKAKNVELPGHLFESQRRIKHQI